MKQLKLDINAFIGIEFTGPIQVTESSSVGTPEPMDGLTVQEQSQIVEALARDKRRRKHAAWVKAAASRDRLATAPRHEVTAVVRPIGTTERLAVRPRREHKLKIKAM